MSLAGAKKEDLGSNLSRWSQICCSTTTRGGVSGVGKAEGVGPKKINSKKGSDMGKDPGNSSGEALGPT